MTVTVTVSYSFTFTQVRCWYCINNAVMYKPSHVLCTYMSDLGYNFVIHSINRGSDPYIDAVAADFAATVLTAVKTTLIIQ